MVLLPMPTSPPGSSDRTGVTRSSSVSVLPTLVPGGRLKNANSSLPTSHSQPLGLGPADRSLLPDQQRQRRNKHVGCQTSSSELADLRTLQEHLVQVKQELATVNQELVHAERRLRHEVREEMEERVKKFEKRTMEKVAFLRQRQESSVNTMRKASRAQCESHKAHTEGVLRAEHDRKRKGEEAALAQMASQLEQRDLLIAGYKRENRELREQLERLRDNASPPPLGKKLSSPMQQLDVAEQTAQLEAALAQRDATIRALREQLARVQHGLPPETPSMATSHSMPAVGEGTPESIKRRESSKPPKSSKK